MGDVKDGEELKKVIEDSIVQMDAGEGIPVEDLFKSITLRCPPELVGVLDNLQTKLDLKNHGEVFSRAIQVLDLLCKAEGTVTLSVNQKKAEEVGLSDA